MEMALGSPPTGKEGEGRKGDRGMVVRLKKKREKQETQMSMPCDFAHS